MQTAHKNENEKWLTRIPSTQSFRCAVQHRFSNTYGELKRVLRQKRPPKDRKKVSIENKRRIERANRVSIYIPHTWALAPKIREQQPHLDHLQIQWQRHQHTHRHTLKIWHPIYAISVWFELIFRYEHSRAHPQPSKRVQRRERKARSAKWMENEKNTNERRIL